MYSQPQSSQGEPAVGGPGGIELILCSCTRPKGNIPGNLAAGDRYRPRENAAALHTFQACQILIPKCECIGAISGHSIISVDTHEKCLWLKANINGSRIVGAIGSRPDVTTAGKSYPPPQWEDLR